MRVMLMIKGDPEPGAAPSEELLGAMGRYNDELKTAGVLVDLAGLLPSAEGRRVKFAEGNRTVIEGPFPESKQLIAATGSSKCSRWTRPWSGPSVPRSRRFPGSTRASTAPRARSRSVECSSWRVDAST
jgi:YCII-related domain